MNRYLCKGIYMTLDDVKLVLDALVASGTCNVIGEGCYLENGETYPAAVPCCQ